MTCHVVRPWPWPAACRALVFDDRRQLDEAVLAHVVSTLIDAPSPRCVLASGATFAEFFAIARARVETGLVDFGHVQFHHLDEFCGVPRRGPGSLAAEIGAAFFPDAGPRRGTFHAIDATAADVAARQDLAVARATLTLLGIGTNGHLAFNEPGTPFGSRSHLADLTPATRAAHAGRFGDAPVPSVAVTAGLATITSSKKLFLVARGESKARAVRAALAGPLDPGCPASVIRLHDDVTMFFDRAAAQLWLDDVEVRAEPHPMARFLDGTVPTGGPVLAVAPHPDDASISCGGLLLSLPVGTRKVIATFSTGARAAGGLDEVAGARLREAEATEEAQILGAEPRFLRARAYTSGVLEPADVDDVLRLLREIRPAAVLVPSRFDPHPTHRLCRLTVEEAIRRTIAEDGGSVDVWTFEGPWCQIPRDDVNVLLKLDEATRTTKRKGILCHRSQIGRVPFEDGARSLERLRAITFSETDLGGRAEGGFDFGTHLECFHRARVERAPAQR